MLALAACSQRLTPLQRLEPRSVDDTPCDAIDAMCPSDATSCATCVEGLGAFYAGFCNVDDGDDPCDGDTLSNDYRAYCKVQACNDNAEAACLAEGEAACKPTCSVIEPIVADCPGWQGSAERESCDELTTTEEACIAEVLNDLATTGNECVNWYQPRIICLGKHIGLEGYASCAIQDCLGLTTLEACAQNFEILCGWTL